MVIIETINDIQNLVNDLIGDKKIGLYTSYVMRKEDVVFHEGHNKMAEFMKNHFDIVIVELVLLQSKYQTSNILIDNVDEDIILDINNITDDIQNSIGCNVDFFIVRNVLKKSYNEVVLKINNIIKDYVISENKMAHRELMPSFMAAHLLLPLKSQITWCKSLKGITHNRSCSSFRSEFYKRIDSSLVLDPAFMLTPIFRDTDGLLYSRTNPIEIYNFRLEVRDVIKSIDLNTKPKELIKNLRNLQAPEGYTFGSNCFDIENVDDDIYGRNTLPEKGIIYFVINEIKQSKLNRWEDCRLIGMDETKAYDSKLIEIELNN